MSHFIEVSILPYIHYPYVFRRTAHWSPTKIWHQTVLRCLLANQQGVTADSVCLTAVPCTGRGILEYMGKPAGTFQMIWRPFILLNTHNQCIVTFQKHLTTLAFFIFLLWPCNRDIYYWIISLFLIRILIITSSASSQRWFRDEAHVLLTWSLLHDHHSSGKWACKPFCSSLGAVLSLFHHANTFPLPAFTLGCTLSVFTSNFAFILPSDRVGESSEEEAFCNNNTIIILLVNILPFY